MVSEKQVTGLAPASSATPGAVSSDSGLSVRQPVEAASGIVCSCRPTTLCAFRTQNMCFRSVKKIEERLDAVEELLNMAGAMDEDGASLQPAWLVAADTTYQHNLQQAMQSWS